ncbi:hypothetical protein SDC9_132873 [bioreactor metagenome]|uniref:Uncharacterized protein n=1 Tax=bioreactor metagenome TaxID=1076179 RepID=A0A645D941_9ZZZZ
MSSLSNFSWDSIFLSSCPPTKKDAINAIIVTLLIKFTIGNSDKPGVATLPLTSANPIPNPKITMIRIGEYLVPATTVRAINTIGINNNSVSQS